MTDAERYERGQAIVRDVEREFAGRPMPEMVEEVRARVEKLMVVEGGSYCAYLMKPVAVMSEVPKEVHPARAFPDHFYYQPEIRTVADVPDIRQSAGGTAVPGNRQLWIAPTENFGARSHQDWYRSAPACSGVGGLFCQCGHPWEDHAPACVHLIEGCGCEGFLKVPQSGVEGA